jgi:WXXGXW repeat (2 copies)
MRRIFLVPLGTLLLGACTATSTAYPAVPAPRAELVPVPPRSSVPLIWQPGHYDWDGARFLWVPGRWVDRAGHGTLWQDGYWRREGSGYVWVPAHWM